MTSDINISRFFLTTDWHHRLFISFQAA